ncbi:MAG: hypothetical protein WCQ21_26095 [Verrucomicrobiota bacterium]|jgi:hypothetical protein
MKEIARYGTAAREALPEMKALIVSLNDQVKNGEFPGGELNDRGTGGAQTVVHTLTNLVCGDAYLVDGQSNAEATGPNNGPTEDPVTPINYWIRS